MVSNISGNIQIKRRAVGGAIGAPSSLRSGEPAWNNADQTLYIGMGDNGSGMATSIVPIGGWNKYLELVGAQTVGGIKTFESSPLVPTPANDDNSKKSANTEWVRGLLANYGAGDMSKSTYDSNNNGSVDSADYAATAPWAGISGKPTQFAPAPHDAALVTSGVFDIARIPVLPSQKQIMSTGGISSLSTGQQAEIGQGTVVTTTDGRRWVYSGSGSKTAEASYVVLADITPEWGAIANTPTTLLGYGITDAQPLDATLTALAGLTGAADKGILFTGADQVATFTLTAFGRSILDDTSAGAVRATLELGTIATQAASNVAITGGTIENVTMTNSVFDGGTF